MSDRTDSSAAPVVTSLVGAFAGSLERPRPPRLYQAGLGIAALAMIVLPVIYVAVIAAAGWLVYLQATRGFYFGSGIWAAITYLTPIVAGTIMVFFMVKPLLARPPPRPNPRTLQPAEEPLLHAFVERICDLVGSPKPREIRVDCQVNASAAFRRGLASFAGKDLVLTVGMPLAAGLRADQLAGVLAHEFGHFSQGGGMRLSYLVRSISAWFHRVVYERDEWDLRLERWARDADWRVGIALHVARLGVWISRKVLYGLMMAGLGVSSFLLRQMEFDADLYETRLAGSKTFVETSLEIELLNTALQRALSQVADLWREKHLVDDIPGLTAALRREFSEDAPSRLQSALAQIDTSALDTHPATKDRIAAALRDDAKGIFTAQNPSSKLFSNFQELCLAATHSYYQSDLGLQYDPQQAITVAAAMERRQEAIRATELTHQITGGLVRFSNAVRLTEREALGREKALKELQEAKAELGRSTGTLQAEVEKFDQAWERRFDLNSAEALLRAGFTIDPRAFAVSRPNVEVVDEAIRSADRRIASFEQVVDKARSIVERRLAAARDLASSDDPSKAAEWKLYGTALNALADAASPLLELQREIVGMSVILQNSAGREEDENLLTPLNNMGLSAHGKLERALSKLGDTLYPFEHERGEITLATHLTEGADQLILQRGAFVSNRATELYFRILDRLAALTMEVEVSLAKIDDSTDI